MATSAGRAQQPLGQTATKVLVAMVAALVAADAVLRSVATGSGAGSRRAAAATGGAAGAAGASVARPRTRGRTLALLAVALLLAAATAAAVIALTSSSSRSSGSSGSGAAAARLGSAPLAGPTVPVQRRDLTVSATVPGRLGYAAPELVFDRLHGRISSLPRVGQVIAAGQPLFRVAGTPVVLLYGSTAAHRALAPSDHSGADVRQLNANLHALGFGGLKLVVSDVWQPATTIAVKQLQGRLGAAQTGRLQLGTVVFLPTAQVVLARHAGVGASAAIAHATTSHGSNAKPSAPPTAKPTTKAGAPLTTKTQATTAAAETTPSQTTPAGSGTDPTASAAASSARSSRTRERRRQGHDTTTTVTFAEPGTDTTTAPSTTAAPPTPAPGNPQTVTATVPTTVAPTHTAPATTAPASTTPATKTLQQTIAEKRKQQQQAALQAQKQAALQAQEQATLKAEQQAAAEKAQQQAVTPKPTNQPRPASSGSSGATTNKRAPASRPVVPLALLSTAPANLLITVEVSPQQKTLATVGRQAEVRLPDGSSQPGKVVTVGASTPQGTLMTVELSKPLSDPSLDHSAVSVTFVLREARGVLAVPKAALITTPAHGSAVAQVGPSPTLLRVSTGLSAGGYVQISGPGIHQGLSVAASGPLAAKRLAQRSRAARARRPNWL